MDERGEAILRSDASDVEENCLFSRSFVLKADKALPGKAECCACAAALAADLKLLVDGGCRRPA